MPKHKEGPKRSFFSYGILMHMLEIVCAIYPEAVPFIQNLDLKKEPCIRGCDSFVNEEVKIRLTLTGVGKVKAASVVSLLLNQSEDPYLLSFGSAFGYEEGLFLAHKITDIDTQRSFYPDMILSTDIEEKTFLSGSRILYAENDVTMVKNNIYDMESSAIFEAASRFIGPHQMSFVRFVSDHDAKSVKAKDIEKKAEFYYPHVKRLIEEILAFQKQKERTEKEDDLIDIFSLKIHATHTMKEEIRQIVRYAKASGIDYQKIMLECTKAEISNKEEGKKVLNIVKRRICE